MAFILAFTVHLGHLLEAVKHTLHDLLISLVHVVPNVKVVGTNELILNLANVDREVLDKVCHALAFLTGQFRLLNALYLVILKKKAKHEFMVKV